MQLFQMRDPNYFLIFAALFIVFCMGATIFSYLNLVIEKLPQGEDVIHGRSCCPHCGHEKKGKDSIPIVSWIKAGHKCPYCFEEISPKSTIMEGIGGVLAVILVCICGVTIKALLIFIGISVVTVFGMIRYNDMN